MWKVVSVDDELLVRNNLRSLIPWEEHGFTICGEASGATDAIRLIEGTAPHLAIIDMNMPGIDGVELIQSLSRTHPSLLVVALSSYDSYDYVRGSLSYGALDYLLKHRLTAESLITVLGKVRSRLESELKEQIDRQKELKKWRTVSPALSQSYLKELMIGAAPHPPEYREHFESMPYGRDGQRHIIVLMKLLNFDLLLTRKQEHDLTLFIRSVVDLCSQISGDNGCVVYMERGTFGMLLSMDDGHSEHLLQQWVYGKISRIEKSVELYFNCTPVFVQSTILRSIDSLPTQYIKLLGKLDELQGRPSYTSDVEETPLSYLTISHEKELLSAAENCDAGATSQIIKKIVGVFSASGAISLVAIGRLTAELLQLAAKIAQKGGIQTDWIFQHMAVGQKQLGSPQDMEKVLLQIFDKLMGDLREAQIAHGFSRYVAQAIQRIQTDYKDGLSLEETADRMGITPAYLSRLFKEESGSTFTEYLTAYRIARSRQLISSRACTVKEISKQVGFNSYSYFIKIFKEHTGETPHVYAEKYGK
jgi:two-component system response regulator YesN